MLTPESLQGAAVSGAGNALDRLTNFFMDMAEEMFPVIEIDAGRAIELVLNRGATLRIADCRTAGKDAEKRRLSRRSGTRKSETIAP